MQEYSQLPFCAAILPENYLGRFVKKIRYAIIVLVVLNSPIASSWSSEKSDSGLPLPRFVSLGDDRVNARAGPGFRFPINWVYLRKNFPVEVIEEFGHWRRIKDIDGIEGWIHLSMLSGRRTFIIHSLNAEPSVLILRGGPSNQSAPVAQVEIGAHGNILECGEGWCRVELTPLRGWLSKHLLWGVYEHEFIN